jgi:hypothetical protein
VSPGETAARLALADMMAIAQRSRDSVMARFQAMEDRLWQAQRDLEQAPPPDCTCGEPECKRGVCR